MKKRTRPDRVLGWAAAFSLVLLLGADAPERGAKSDARVNRTDIGANRPLLSVEPEKSATIRQTTRGASSGLQNGPRQTNPAPVAPAAARGGGIVRGSNRGGSPALDEAEQVREQRRQRRREDGRRVLLFFVVFMFLARVSTFSALGFRSTGARCR